MQTRRKYPLLAAHAIAEAWRGHGASLSLTTEEEVGFMLIADMWQCLSHLRESFSEKKR